MSHETADSDRYRWADLRRPTPSWWGEAKLGIFIHWGPYSVPAWAEPSGALGEVAEQDWFRHNAYAEWYGNTIRIPGSPAAQHHREIYGDAPYDDFLDAWTAEHFDPAGWAELFAAAGASYVIPTTKHHDGVALWDAPGTGTRNTVHRGPRRDLVREIADAVRAAGLRFGVYYSGGLDWHVSNFPPHQSFADVRDLRPTDPAYNAYALLHVRDLMERYEPTVLWNDIEWPDAGKRTGSWSLHELFSDFYARTPDGLVNDRWGDTHWDFRTSEYSAGTELESEPEWQNCRGIGLSFGYNQVEGPDQLLTGPELARLLGDIVSRGGHLLLNVGPTAAGEIPPDQQESLRGLGRWMSGVGGWLRQAVAWPDGPPPSDEPWIRWLNTPTHVVALVDQPGETRFAAPTEGLDLAAASLIGRGTVEAQDGDLVVRVDVLGDGPAAVLLPRR